MIITTPRRPQSTPSPGTSGTYNHAPFPDGKPSQALIEEDEYMAKYATEPLIWTRWALLGWRKLRQLIRPVRQNISHKHE